MTIDDTLLLRSTDFWKRHIINRLWSSSIDKAILFSVLSWLHWVSPHTIISSVQPFYYVALLSKVSSCHFSPLNGFNCPDDLNQKTITKGESSTGNYCVHREIENTWMELPAFTLVKLHVLSCCHDENRGIKYILQMLYMSFEETAYEKTPTLQSQTSWEAHIHAATWKNSGFRASWNELENRLRGSVSKQTLFLP